MYWGLSWQFSYKHYVGYSGERISKSWVKPELQLVANWCSEKMLNFVSVITLWTLSRSLLVYCMSDFWQVGLSRVHNLQLSRSELKTFSSFVDKQTIERLCFTSVMSFTFSSLFSSFFLNSLIDLQSEAKKVVSLV